MLARGASRSDKRDEGACGDDRDAPIMADAIIESCEVQDPGQVDQSTSMECIDVLSKRSKRPSYLHSKHPHQHTEGLAYLTVHLRRSPAVPSAEHAACSLRFPIEPISAVSADQRLCVLVHLGEPRDQHSYPAAPYKNRDTTT